MDNFQNRQKNRALLIPGTGKGIPQALKPKSVTPIFPSRPTASYDFAVNNGLSGGGLPAFDVESDIITHTPPQGYIAVVQEIEYYLSPMRADILPGQLALKIFVDNALLAGQGTMSTSQGQLLTNRFIPIPEGKQITVRLGRGPGVLSYSLSTISKIASGLTLYDTYNDNSYLIGHAGRLLFIPTIANYGTGQYAVLESQDGINWYPRAIIQPTWANTSGGRNVISDGINLYVMGGNGTLTTNVWKSTDDGKTWAQITAAGGFTANQTYVITAYFAGQLWRYQRNGGATATEMWHSTNGVSWANAGNASFGVKYGVPMIVYDNKLWIIDDEIWNSVDGTTWTQILTTAQTPWTFSFPHASAAVINNTMYVFGVTYAGADNAVFYSTDGITWTQFTGSNALTNALTSTRWNKAAQYNGQMYIMERLQASSLSDVFKFNDLLGIYNPNLKVFCEMRGIYLRSRGTVEDTLRYL